MYITYNDLRGKLNCYVATYMQKLVQEIRSGISDDEVAGYVYDVVASIANMDQIDYKHILTVLLTTQGDAQVLTQSEMNDWLRYVYIYIYADPTMMNISRRSTLSC